MASASAQIAKEKGNASFKNGDYPAAIGHYSTAIVADTKDFTLPLNRAAAYLKLGKHTDAERDCTTALELNPANVKALFRRGQARYELGKLAEAEKDLQEALKREPNNEVVKQELQKIAATAKTKALPRKTPISIPAPPLQTDAIPMTSKSTAPKRRRIPITIIEPPSNTDHHSTTALSSATDLLKPVATRSLTSEAAKVIASPSSQSAPKLSTSIPETASSRTSKDERGKTETFRDAKRARDVSKPSRAGGGIFKSTGNYTLFEERVGTTPAPSSNSDTMTKGLLPSNDIPAGTSSPMSSFMFVRSWESLKDPLKQWKLLMQIPPDSLSSMFQNALEPHIFVSIMGTLQTVLHHLGTAEKEEAFKGRKWIAAYVNGLAKIPRFTTLTMFMSGAEKSTARKVLLDLSENGVEVQGWPTL